MRSFLKIVVLGLVILIPLSASAGTLEDFTQAQKQYLAAGACMAAYSDRYGSLAIAAFEQEGWKIEPHMQTGNGADVKYILAWDTHSQPGRDSYVLAVAGAERTLDVKTFFRTRKVYFAGATMEEFAANAARKDVPAEVPKVHEGFNQAAQLLLSLESEQSHAKQPGKSIMLTSILLENPNTKVFLAGHSMGGAVVTLVAARLLDMGVRPEQIEVITFGAPSVGNDQFVQKYENKIPLTRIVVEGDPIPVALRRVFGGYRPLGGEIVWPVPDALKSYTQHDISVYLDIALTKYYPLKRQAINEGISPAPEPIPGRPRLYVAPIKNSLPKELKEEFVTMREGLLSQYDDILPGYILDTGTEYDETTTLKKAAAAGCDLLAVAEIQALRVQNEDNTYFVSLIQTVYRVEDGNIVSLENFGSSTKILTPMVALVLDARSMRADSAAWINAKQSITP
jgi:hypothetical protein